VPVSGCDDDPRPLGAIPEVRALFRELVATGLVALFTTSTIIRPAGFWVSVPGKGCPLGGLEVFLAAEGKFLHVTGEAQVHQADLIRFVEQAKGPLMERVCRTAAGLL